jgi:hypothetical protein
MSSPPLPPCRHRGEQLLPDRWLCHSDRLVLRTGLVSGDTCRARCPYVDHDGPGDRTAADTPGVEVDLDPGLVAVGVITAPRAMATLPQTIAELRRAGFTQPTHVFAEPAAPVPNDPGLVVRQNPVRLGLWGNWLAAARRMLADTDAPFLLLCEDDVRFAPCAALAIQHAIDTLPHATWGYVSLYTPRHNLPDPGGPAGWREVPVGPGTWGALAWCFTRDGLRAVLDSKAVRAHASPQGTDAVVSLAVRELNRKGYFHAPSLGDHTGGDVSTEGHRHLRGEALGLGFSPAYRGYVERRAGISLSGPARIPRIIHQIWIGPLPPPVEWLRSWTERHSGWEYRLWTEHTTPFPLRNQAQFDAAPQYCGKADILRYEVLLRYGGVYADADMRCLRPFTEDDLRYTFFSVYEDEGRHPGLINSCLIGCAPGSPILEAAVAAIGRLAPAEVAATPAWVCTGPTLLTRCVGRTGDGVYVFPSEAFIPVHFQAGAVDPARLARARTVHYFQSSPVSEEFAAFREPLASAAPVTPLRDELTVVVQTSFVPSHPDTAMLERSLDSLKLLGGRPRFLFLFDGLRGSPAEERRYRWYKRLARARFPGEFFEAEDWVQSGGCLRRALDRVTTPYLLYWEHDWELSRPIDTAGVLRALRDDPGVRSVRLNKRTTLEAPGDLELRPRPAGPVPLVATPCWSANPHFARTETYRSFVLPTCADAAPLEVPLFEAALQAYYARGLIAQHAEWGNCIYGSVGDAAVVGHLDGRTFAAPPDPRVARSADAYPACGCPPDAHCECAALHSYREAYRRLLAIARPGKVFEWGPGPNTRLALEAGAEVVSREFDPKWVPDVRDPKLAVELVEWAGPRWTDLGPDRDAEVFFVDSRRRSDCLAAVLDQAPAESLVCLHDAQRRRYHPALAAFGYVFFAEPGFAVASRSAGLLGPVARLMSRADAAT